MIKKPGPRPLVTSWGPASCNAKLAASGSGLSLHLHAPEPEACTTLRPSRLQQPGHQRQGRSRSCRADDLCAGERSQVSASSAGEKRPHKSCQQRRDGCSRTPKLSRRMRGTRSASFWAFWAQTIRPWHASPSVRPGSRDSPIPMSSEEPSEPDSKSASAFVTSMFASLKGRR